MDKVYFNTKFNFMLGGGGGGDVLYFMGIPSMDKVLLSSSLKCRRLYTRVF